jgi:hypothetical protein
MAYRRRFALLVGAVVVTVASVGGSAVADSASRSQLYREDVVADFIVRDPNCAADRTQLTVSFHQDFFRDAPGPATRSVVFGIGIQQFDCQEQFVSGAFGNESFARPFDVKSHLRGATVHTTVQACITFPDPGGCFPVQIDLTFDGIGKADVTKNRVHVNEPDCKINQLEINALRNAHVSGTISFTPPGGELQSFELSSADLSPAGAILSSQYTRTMISGTGPACTNQ